MELKSIQLTAVDDPDFAARLTFALGLAEIFSAELTVVHALPLRHFHASTGRSASALFSEALREAAEEHAAKLRAETFRVADELGKDVRWISDNDDVQDIVAREALLSDLTIVGRSREVRLEDWIRDHLVDYLTKTVATPVLYLPPGVPPVEKIGTLIIAWDASHPAMRAIRGALPFLRRADAVHIVAVGKRVEDVSALKAYLSRHGVSSQTHAFEATSAGVAGSLLEKADRLGTDWIVMGANSKPKIHSLLFGSVTRSLMHETTRPLLMSA